MKATITNAVKSVGSDDRGVSPVIGVILMVAITVILAAVIGTMVLGMTDSVGQNVQAGATASFSASDTANDPGEVRVTWNSNQNADHLEVKIEGEAGANAATASTGAKTTTLEDVSDSQVFYEASDTDSDHEVIVTVTAVSEDGSKTVVLEDKGTL